MFCQIWSEIFVHNDVTESERLDFHGFTLSVLLCQIEDELIALWLHLPMISVSLYLDSPWSSINVARTEL